MTLWKKRKEVSLNRDIISYLSKVRDIDNAEEYLNPPVTVLHSPLLLKNIIKAYERVKRAIDNRESIVIVSDPDVDGMTSTVIMYHYLKKVSRGKIQIATHERSKGHGVQNTILPNDIDLLIIVDSSSSEVNACRKLSKHMDIVILDHHIVEKDNPYAIIVNPQQKGCDYPNKHLSAAGVVFKFVELLDYHYKKVNTDYYLDLVATGLLADQMRMDILENRWFVKNGLKQINNAGLLALIYESRNNGKEINSQIINFSIVPVLNTVARNDQIRKGITLLLLQDFFEARKMAKTLLLLNEERKRKVELLVDEYEKIMANEKFIFVTSPNATKNYNGLIAQKLASKYMKPAFVLKDNDSILAGSYRSYAGFNLLDFLKRCPYVKKAAGHSEAGGFEIDKSNFQSFKEYVDKNISEDMFESSIVYDIELKEEDIDFNLADKIAQFDFIYGNGSPKITLKIKDVFIEERELFPKNTKKHVKVVSDGFDMLKFNDSDYAKDVDSWSIVDVVGDISINEWGKDRRIQLFLKDYKVK